MLPYDGDQTHGPVRWWTDRTNGDPERRMIHVSITDHGAMFDQQRDEVHLYIHRAEEDLEMVYEQLSELWVEMDHYHLDQEQAVNRLFLLGYHRDR